MTAMVTSKALGREESGRRAPHVVAAGDTTRSGKAVARGNWRRSRRGRRPATARPSASAARVARRAGEGGGRPSGGASGGGSSGEDGGGALDAEGPGRTKPVRRGAEHVAVRAREVEHARRGRRPPPQPAGQADDSPSGASTAEEDAGAGHDNRDRPRGSCRAPPSARSPGERDAARLHCRAPPGGRKACCSNSNTPSSPSVRATNRPYATISNAAGCRRPPLEPRPSRLVEPDADEITTEQHREDRAEHLRIWMAVPEPGDLHPHRHESPRATPPPVSRPPRPAGGSPRGAARSSVRADRRGVGRIPHSSRSSSPPPNLPGIPLLPSPPRRRRPAPLPTPRRSDASAPSPADR